MDDPYTLAYCDRPDAEVIERARAIRLLVLDVDGVLTDGTLYIGADGETVKPFHAHDGKGIALARAAGIAVAIVTARRSASVEARATELGVDALFQAVPDKAATVSSLTRNLDLKQSEVAYVGDDLVDLGTFARVGLAIAVANAHPLLSRRSHWETRRRGGAGAVREVCELLLAAQGRLGECFRRHE